MKMNADGDIFKQMKDISKITWDATTSRDSFENYAISAGTAGLTAGISNAEIVRNIDTATTTGKITKALADSAISTVSSTAAQSAVNGESFSDSLKEQGTNILVGAVSNVGAKHIGMNYKTSAQTGVDKAIQLVSHAGLGAATAELTGNDALSGAVSGVVGEVGGEFIDKNTNLSNNAIKELAGLAGGYSAIFTGNLVGLSDGEVAGNIFSGSRIGKNAAENNALANIIGASIGGVTGGLGSAWGAYIAGGDLKAILASGASGVAVGATSGFLFNPSGVLMATTLGTAVGTTTGALSGGGVTYYLNPDASMYEIADNAAKGAINGGINGLILSPLGYLSGASIPAQSAISILGLQYDLLTGSISNEYNIIKNPETLINETNN